jgi:hypothetical protein
MKTTTAMAMEPMPLVEVLREMASDNPFSLDQV